MAVLEHKQSKLRRVLNHHTTVGRDPSCRVPLKDELASAEHAILRFREDKWMLRDLASTNHTFVDGNRIAPLDEQEIAEGAEICFGNPDDPWVLIDAGPPVPAARHLATGITIQGSKETLYLVKPNVAGAAGAKGFEAENEPKGMVYASGDAGWVLEVDGQTRSVRDVEHVEVDGDLWELLLPVPFEETVRRVTAQPNPHTIKLEFQVSKDEETVHIVMHHRNTAMPLKDRVYHYTLLTLARARIKDQGDPELPVTEHGWIYIDDLCSMLRIAERKLNVDVFRMRSQFEDKHMENSAGIIERRNHARQIRIGARNLVVGPPKD